MSPWRHPPVIASGLIEETMAMSLEAARKLSIPELLRVLNEKLDLEYSRVQETTPPLGVLVGSLLEYLYHVTRSYQTTVHMVCAL